MDVIKEMVQYLKENPNNTIYQFFEDQIWSLEKEEWQKMSDDERELFEILLWKKVDKDEKTSED
jgi:hypothetical protein